MTNNDVSDFFSNSVQIVAVEKFFQLLQDDLNEQRQKFQESMEHISYLESINNISILERLANQGDVCAQNKIANTYYMMAQEAKPLFSDNTFGWIESIHNLRYKMYRKKAHDWYLEAAKQNNSSAQCHLGSMYYNGDGVAVDHNEASQWYLKAVANGSLEAHCHLGHMFQKANNYEKAAEWYLTAIELGSKDAEGYYQVLKNYL